MLRSLFCLTILFLSFDLTAQFWFGPKVGGSYTVRNYEDAEWEKTYDVANTFSAHFGGVMNYTTHETFSVHAELYFERTKNKVKNRPSSGLVSSETGMSMLNMPLLLRYRVPFNEYLSMYFNFGPRLSYFLSGSGEILTDDEFFAEDNLGVINYKIRFSGDRSVERLVLDKPRRIKYALEAGTGFYLDLINHRRIMFDFRYSIGHSFMSFNDGSELHLALEESGYVENFEYRSNMIQFSVSYLFGYDPVDSKRGRSTSRVQRKK